MSTQGQPGQGGSQQGGQTPGQGGQGGQGGGQQGGQKPGEGGGKEGGQDRDK